MRCILAHLGLHGTRTSIASTRVCMLFLNLTSAGLCKAGGTASCGGCCRIWFCTVSPDLLALSSHVARCRSCKSGAAFACLGLRVFRLSAAHEKPCASWLGPVGAGLFASGFGATAARTHLRGIGTSRLWKSDRGLAAFCAGLSAPWKHGIAPQRCAP